MPCRLVCRFCGSISDWVQVSVKVWPRWCKWRSVLEMFHNRVLHLWVRQHKGKVSTKRSAWFWLSRSSSACKAGMWGWLCVLPADWFLYAVMLLEPFLRSLPDDRKAHALLLVLIFWLITWRGNRVIALFLQGKNKSYIDTQVNGLLSFDSLYDDKQKTLFQVACHQQIEMFWFSFMSRHFSFHSTDLKLCICSSGWVQADWERDMVDWGTRFWWKESGSSSSARDEFEVYSFSVYTHANEEAVGHKPQGAKSIIIV